MLQAGLPRRFEECHRVEDGKQECPADVGQRCRQGFGPGQVAGHDLDLVGK
jgi:hypothetical protein